MKDEKGNNWGKFYPITEEEYLNHGLRGEWPSALFIKTQLELNEIDLNQFNNRIMSNEKEPKLCIKTLKWVMYQFQGGSTPSRLTSEQALGYTVAISHLNQAIQSKIIFQEVPEFAKESESD